MRITNNMLSNNMLNNISSNLVRMDKYQNQLSTGKKIQFPSDEPVVAARALKLRTDVSEVEQFQKNTKDATSWLDITENTLSSMNDIMQRVRELTVQASNGTNTPSDMQKISQEVKQLQTQMYHLGNATYAGRYIFSGYKTDTKLIDETTGNYAINVNNTEDINYEIGIGDSININVPGGELFQVGGGNAVAGAKGSLFKCFDDVLTAMDKGDNAELTKQLKEIDNNMDNVTKIRSDVGARQNRIELTDNRLQNDNINFTKLMSDNEDVDMAETIMNLKNEENVYRASLSGGARIIQTSLVDFLR